MGVQANVIRSALYDRLILGITADWYRAVLERVPPGARLLDVGIGTAGALLANEALVREKSLTVEGIDIDADYIRRARTRLGRSALHDRVRVAQESVYDHHGGPYDAVYFAASFMLLPEPERALRHVRTLLAPGGRIYFTQTFQCRRAPWLERLKPALARLTTIDFGRVTYEAAFRAEVHAAGLTLETLTTLSRRGNRAACLAVAAPADGGD